MNEPRMNEAPVPALLKTLIDLCDDLTFGRTADVERLYALTSKGAAPPPLVRLAEAFGMMLVKVEGRDYGNALLIEELRQRNEELENTRQGLAERNAQLLHVAGERSRDVIGSCPGMKRVVDLAVSIARRPINTLVTGPTGAGKEVVAKLIHFSSPRRNGPFIAVNCTAIPDSLFESEMFGIEKGVATGVDRRKGLIEEAHGGTLFLDEIGDMSLPNQAKLLRVLEEREVLRVGAARPVRVDIKVIAATNAKLADAVRSGKFREDLYYRVNVAEIRLPALRKRGDDILLLAQAFLNRHCDQMGRGHLTLSTDARTCLLAYVWPGNVRELNNEMDVERDDLSPRLRGGPTLPEAALPELARPGRDTPRRAGNVGSQNGAGSGGNLKETPATLNLREAECVLIRRALEHTGGNRARAAKLLGITREGLRKKLIRLQRGQEDPERP